MRRLAATVAAAGVTLAVATAMAPAAAADALAMGQCTTSSNVVLAVNFGHWGGPIVRACGSTPTTGFALLNEGGFRTEGTKHDGPAFICRIQTSAFRGGTAYPRPDEPGQSCGPTPPASAYWSYWHADAGQSSWSYSQLGAMSYKPKPGSVDYWQFGGTNIAGTEGRPDNSLIAKLRANNASATGTSNGGGSQQGGGQGSKSGSTGGSRNGGGSSHEKSSSRGADAGGSTTGGPTDGAGRLAPPAAASTSPSAGRSAAASSSARASQAATTGSSSAPTSSGTSTGAQIINADPASAVPKPKSSGSPLALILAAALVLAFAAGAGFTVWRRRRLDADNA